MDSLVDLPEMRNFKSRMFATPINNTLYGWKKWGLAKDNVHGIEPDALEDTSRY
jgi:hypothetical protein